MSVNAKFVADFTSFKAAVDQSLIKLKDFEAGANKVGPALNKMVDGFSGRKLIQEATMMARVLGDAGSIARLTGAELQQAGAKAAEAADKMRRLGVDVPPGLQKIADAAKRAAAETKGMTTAGEGMSSWLGKATGLLGAFGVGLSVGAVVNFGKSLLNDADALVKMHDKTAVSIQWLQKFQVAGDDAGNTVEELAASVNMMQKRFDDPAFKAALDTLKINFADIRNLSPELQFVAMGDAIRGIEDPVLQAQLATDLFGKTGVTVLPTLKRGFDDVKNSAVGMSDATVIAMDKAGDKLASWWRTFKGMSAEAIVFLATLPGRGATDTGAMFAHPGKDIALPAAAKGPDPAAMVGPLQDLETEMRIYQDLLKQQEQAHGKSAAAAQKHKEELAKMHVEILKLETVLPGVSGQFGSVDDSVLKLGGRIRELVKDLSALERTGWSNAGVFRAFAVDLEKLGEQVDAAQIHEYAQEWAFTGPTLDMLDKKTNTFSDDLGGLAQSLGTLAQVSGDSFGGVLKSLSQVVAGASVAVTAFESITKAAATMSTNTASSIASMATGYASLFSMGIQLGIAWTNMNADVARANASLDAFNASVYATLTAEEKLAGGTRKLFGMTIANDSQAVLLAVRDAYVALGLSAEQATKDVERFWASRSDKDRATIDANLAAQREMTDAIHAMGLSTEAELQAVADKSKAVFEYMERSGKYSAEQLAVAWEDFAKKQALALGEVAAVQDEGAKAAGGALDELAAKYKSLSDSVAKEAPERVMGSVERGTRAQMAVLQKQMDAQNKNIQSDAEDAAAAMKEAFEKLKIDPVHIDVVWNVPSVPGVGSVKPPSSFTGGNNQVTTVIELDGKVIADVVTKEQDKNYLFKHKVHAG